MTRYYAATAWDLAGSWPDELVGFRVGSEGDVVWESAQASRTHRTVRISRLVPQASGRIRQVIRYVDPWTIVRLVWGD